MNHLVPGCTAPIRQTHSTLYIVVLETDDFSISGIDGEIGFFFFIFGNKMGCINFISFICFVYVCFK